MSGGEQQMCAIGRALMAHPKLLLLDEPSMGLAPIFVEKIFEIIVEINKQGTPILLVEQNALMALDVAHRGYVLETGTIALADDARALRDERASAQDLPRRGVASSRPAAGSRAARAGSRSAARRRRARAPSRSAAPTPCVGTNPSCRAATASRQPATSTAPSRLERRPARIPVGERQQRMARAAAAVGGDRARVRRPRARLGERRPSRAPLRGRRKNARYGCWVGCANRRRKRCDQDHRAAVGAPGTRPARAAARGRARGRRRRAGSAARAGGTASSAGCR